jgi:hypothetical protein
MDEGIDFYFNEQGLMVLTATFLKKRGYCCKNKCTNCPWNFEKEIGHNASKLIINKRTNLDDATTKGEQDPES